MNDTMAYYILRGQLYEVRAVNPASNGRTKAEDRVRVIGYIAWDPNETEPPLKENPKTPRGWRVVLKGWAYHGKS